MRKTRSLDAAYFEDLYRADPDPWRYQTSGYEAQKYAATLAAIEQEPVNRAFELGCSIGVLTQQLATKCGQVVATDLSERALDQARRRCVGFDNIDFVLAKRSTDGMAGDFDLILLSEVIYFWDDQDLGAVASAIVDSLRVGGRLVLVHWLGETDYPRSADAAIAALFQRIGGLFTVEQEGRTAEYRMDVWRRGKAAHPTAARLGVRRARRTSARARSISAGRS